MTQMFLATIHKSLKFAWMKPSNHSIDPSNYSKEAYKFNTYNFSGSAAKHAKETIQFHLCCQAMRLQPWHHNVWPHFKSHNNVSSVLHCYGIKRPLTDARDQCGGISMRLKGRMEMLKANLDWYDLEWKTNSCFTWTQTELVCIRAEI